ncbi:MAG: hypothetical protein D6695_10960 [Planctomycetota bacterium]|nr:MAG: hypothetical protein D6695_10960 [Planctomycetota bacterium]
MSTVKHIVEQGEYLSLIALNYGLASWRDIYDHPDNAEFRRLRPDPNLIYPGDVVFVPSPEQAEYEGATEQRHRFRHTGPRRSVRIYFKDLFGESLINEPYRLKLDGQDWTEDQTDGEGMVYLEVPMSCRHAKFEIAGYEHDFMFSQLDPVTTVSGIQARLNHLGYWCGRVDGIYGPLTAGGMEQFQRYEHETNGLEVSSWGWPEKPSLQRLSLVHDGIDAVGDEPVSGRFIIDQPGVSSEQVQADADDSSDADNAHEADVEEPIDEHGPQEDEDEPDPV